MSEIKLKSIFRKREYAAILETISSTLDSPAYVTDLTGGVLFGEPSETPTSFNIEWQDQPLGTLHGDSSAKVLHEMIHFLIHNESVRKDVGKEVLDLYREINLIYNFSEKLADTIDRKAIGLLSLQEARKLIQSHGGMVLVWDTDNQTTESLAEVGTISGWELNEIKNEILKNLANESSVKVLNFENIPSSDTTPKLLFAPLKVKANVLGAIILFGDNQITYKASDLKLITTIALQAASAIESAMLYETRIQEVEKREESLRKMQIATARFVPAEFIRSLGRDSLMDVQLGDQTEKIVSVVFVDIRGFTTLAEQMTPEENFKFVNAFNSRLGPIIKKHQGFVNQYLGDGLMAIFPGSPDQALVSSVEIQKEILSYNQYRISKNRKPIRAGIGIHTGPLILGITGDDERLDATTISDTVNTAARVESLTKYYKTNIIISEKSLNLIEDRDRFHTRDLGMVQVKGRIEPISIFECFDGDADDIFALKLETCKAFNHGVYSYVNKSFRDSTKSLSQVLVANPDDETAQIFLAKISQMITSEFDSNWNGVEKIVTK